jgi:hypothetical protein
MHGLFRTLNRPVPKPSQLLYNAGTRILEFREREKKLDVFAENGQNMATSSILLLNVIVCIFRAVL